MKLPYPCEIMRIFRDKKIMAYLCEKHRNSVQKEKKRKRVRKMACRGLFWGHCTQYVYEKCSIWSGFWVFIVSEWVVGKEKWILVIKFLIKCCSFQYCFLQEIEQCTISLKREWQVERCYCCIMIIGIENIPFSVPNKCYTSMSGWCRKKQICIFSIWWRIPDRLSIGSSVLIFSNHMRRFPSVSIDIVHFCSSTYRSKLEILVYFVAIELLMRYSE